MPGLKGFLDDTSALTRDAPSNGSGELTRLLRRRPATTAAPAAGRQSNVDRMTTTLKIPSITRKKPVPGHEKPNSFRVLGELGDAVSYSPPPLRAIRDGAGGRDFSVTLPLPSWRHGDAREALRNIRFRGHCSVGFLRKNVKIMNDPVGVVPTVTDEGHWWPSHVPRGARPQPPHTTDTTARDSFRWPPVGSETTADVAACSEGGVSRSAAVAATTRHGSKLPALPALGIVPVNALPEADGAPRIHRELISYEHQYDSRSADNYTQRGRRHGAFVYSTARAEEAELAATRPDWQIVVGAPVAEAADTAVAPELRGSAGTTKLQRQEADGCVTDAAAATTQQQQRTRLPPPPPTSAGGLLGRFADVGRSELAPRSNLNVRVRHE